MKSRAFSFLVIALLVVAAAAYAQSWRGMGRLQGVVTDSEGKPIEGASVTLRSVRAGNAGPEPILTDKKGKWAALWLMGGTWHIDVEREGYLPQKGTAELSEVQRMPAIKTQLEPEPPPQPAQPVEQVVVGGEVISPEVAAAIENGNRLIGEGKFKDAIAEYEKAQTALPTNLQLKQALARAYYGAGEIAPAIALLQDVVKANPADHTTAVLLANLLLESNKLEDAQKILAGVPADAIKDATTYINIGILFMNKNKANEAKGYFDKAAGLAPDRFEPYYYRGLALVQAGKAKEAKADLQKVMELAPDSAEAKEAAELLAQIK